MLDSERVSTLLSGQITKCGFLQIQSKQERPQERFLEDFWTQETAYWKDKRMLAVLAVLAVLTRRIFSMKICSFIYTLGMLGQFA